MSAQLVQDGGERDGRRAEEWLELLPHRLTNNEGVLHIIPHRNARLCCAVLCYAMLCCAMLCYAMLCCATLRYATLRSAMLCYAMLSYVVLCYAMRRAPR